MQIWIVILSAFAGGSALWAEDLPLQTLRQVEAAYVDQKYDEAFTLLADVPDLLGIAPIFDHPQKEERAEIFFELARIRTAAQDTAQARVILDYVFALSPGVKHGVLNLAQDQAFLRTQSYLLHLRQQRHQEELLATSFWGAAGRSLVLPGWGHFYRGHQKRGIGFMSAAAGAAIYWFLSDRSYRNAYQTYRSTQIGELNLESRTGDISDPQPFKSRYAVVTSRARHANTALGILAAVWLAGMFDHLIVGPAQVHVQIPAF